MFLILNTLEMLFMKRKIHRKIKDKGRELNIIYDIYYILTEEMYSVSLNKEMMRHERHCKVSVLMCLISLNLICRHTFLSHIDNR